MGGVSTAKILGQAAVVLAALTNKQSFAQAKQAMKDLADTKNQIQKQIGTLNVAVQTGARGQDAVREMNQLNATMNKLTKAQSAFNFQAANTPSKPAQSLAQQLSKIGLQGNVAKSALAQLGVVATTSGGSALALFVRLGAAVLSVGTGVTGLIGLFGALTAAIGKGVTSYVDWTQQIRNFRFAGGVSAPEAANLAIAAKVSGTELRDIGISMAILMGQVKSATEESSAAMVALNKQLRDFAQRLEDLKTDHFEKLADAAKDYQDSLADLAENWKRFVQDSNTDEARRREEHGRRVEDINREISEEQIDFATEAAERQIELARKVAEIEEQYANKRLSLWEQYFAASPLLRPFIREQISKLDQLKQSEIDDTRSREALELQSLRRQHERTLEALRRRLVDEGREYDEFMSDLQLKWRREEEDHAKHQANLKEQYDRRLRDEMQMYERQLRDLNEQWADALENMGRTAAGEGGGGALNALRKGLADIGLSVEKMSELFNKNPAEAWIVLADALAQMTAPNRVAILQQIGGLFGSQMAGFLETLASESQNAAAQGKNLLDVYKELYPALFPSEQEQKDAENLYKNWQRVQLIIMEIFAEIGKGFLGMDGTSGAADVMQRLLDDWGDETKRTKIIEGAQRIGQAIGDLVTNLDKLFRGEMSFDDLIKTMGISEFVNNLLVELTSPETQKKVREFLVHFIKDVVVELVQAAGDEFGRIKWGELAIDPMVWELKRTANFHKLNLNNTIMDLIRGPFLTALGVDYAGLRQSLDSIPLEQYYTFTGGEKIVQAIVQGITGKIKTSVTDLTTTVTSIVTTILDALKTTGTYWFDIGKNIIENIAKGIESVKTWFATKISEIFGKLWEGLPDWMKKFIDLLLANSGGGGGFGASTSGIITSRTTAAASFAGVTGTSVGTINVYITANNKNMADEFVGEMTRRGYWKP